MDEKENKNTSSNAGDAAVGIIVSLIAVAMLVGFIYYIFYYGKCSVSGCQSEVYKDSTLCKYHRDQEEKRIREQINSGSSSGNRYSSGSGSSGSGSSGSGSSGSGSSGSSSSRSGSSGSGYSVPGTGKKSKGTNKSSNGASKRGSNDGYSEGYDDLYYNEDYDEDRYDRDSDYAAGVDDAIQDYEEEEGEDY